MFLMTLATRTQTSATISASRNISPKELGAGLNGKTTATPSVQVLMTLSKLYINHQLLIWSSGDLRSSRQKFNFFQVRSIYQYTLDATSHARIWNTALLVKIKSFHSKTSLMVSCYGPSLMTGCWVKGINWSTDQYCLFKRWRLSNWSTPGSLLWLSSGAALASSSGSPSWLFGIPLCHLNAWNPLGSSPDWQSNLILWFWNNWKEYYEIYL